MMLGLQLKLGICSLSVLVLHESLLVSVLIHDSEKMLWKDKSRIRAVQMDNLRRLLGIRRMDRVPNAQIRELCRVTKGVNEMIDECLFSVFSICISIHQCEYLTNTRENQSPSKITSERRFWCFW